MVQQCGEPFLLSLCCSLSYTFKPLGHAFPAQCPARVLLVRVSLGSLATACAAFPAFGHEGHESEAAEEIAVTGEVVNMACYIDHNATGPKHADCAQTCIKMGLPVGIKANDGKTICSSVSTSQSTLSWLPWRPRRSPSKASSYRVTASR